MVLEEATMIFIDNSEGMGNGDYVRNRLLAQIKAATLISVAKTQINPKNTVGVMTMGGEEVPVLFNPTSDLGKIGAYMRGLEIGGETNLAAMIPTAVSALKHRRNKKRQRRIIVFAGSPIQLGKKALESIGNNLKEDGVALDIVNFVGEDEGKTEKLEALLAAVNNNDASHIVHIPPGHNDLSDVLISTPIFNGDGEGGSGFAAEAVGVASAFEFVMDPNLDTNLALALRVSREEERARQEAAAKKAAATEAEPKKTNLKDKENALLKQAPATSMDDQAPGATRKIIQSQTSPHKISDHDVIFYKLLNENRIIFVNGSINSGTATGVVAQLHYLASKSSTKTINMHINSPGGKVSAGFAIYDTMQQLIKKYSLKIRTICVGKAESMASLLLVGGTKGERKSQPNATIMIHQPFGCVRGQFKDLSSGAEQMRETFEKLIELYHKHTGNPKEIIEKKMAEGKDFRMTPKAAKEFGFIDKVC